MGLATEWLSVPHGRIGIDRGSGAMTALRLTEPETEFVGRAGDRGLLRLAAPLPGYGAHFVETGVHGRPELERRGDGLRLVYTDLATPNGRIPVSVEIDLTPSGDGLLLRARVHNGWSDVVPQIVFPQIFGLGPVGTSQETRLQFGRGRLLPFQELTLHPDSAHHLERGLFRYYGYGYTAFNMKWLDYGSPDAGFSLFARDTRYTVQGVLADRPDRAADELDLRWLHNPFLEPGETWESAEYVLLPHPGDWYAGARAYQRFAADAYPYRAPTRVREALGFRSIMLSYLDAPPMYRFTELPELAAEMQGLDLVELCVWGWQTRFGYPMEVDTRLGTAAELADGIKRSQELGVPISIFVSHHLVADSAASDPAWLHLNAGGQRGEANYTCNRDFLPRFEPHFFATDTGVMASALSPEWRETGLESYRDLLDLGATSICFDQFHIWNVPNFNSTRDGRPDEEGDRLLEFGERARDLIHAARPEGTFSGEGVVDAAIPVVDYTWEWSYGHDMADSGPFRYVFPQYRLGASVNEHPRGSLLAFVEGALLNVMPGAMERRLRDCPELVSTLQMLARLRRRLLPYFTEGQFRFDEGLTVTGCVARLYIHGVNVLVLATNPSDEMADVSIELDLSDIGLDARLRQMRVSALDGQELETVACQPGRVSFATRLEPDGLRVLELTPQ